MRSKDRAQSSIRQLLKSGTFAGINLLLIALIFNEWTIGGLFTHSGVQSLPARLILGILDALLIICGLLIAKAGYTSFKNMLREAFFSVCFLAVTALVVEALMQVLVFSSPAIRNIIYKQPVALRNESVIYIPNPRHPQHDIKGFRNSKRYPRVAIIALGDSNTWGVNVRPEKSWPKLLEIMVGKPTYNMGLPGYCPANYLLLLDDVIAMKPDTVIATLYTGNDLYDAYYLVYEGRVLSKLKSHDPAIYNAIAMAEEEEPIADKIDNLTPSTPGFNPANAPTMGGIMPKLREYLESRSVSFNALKVLIIRASRLTNPLTPASYMNRAPDPDRYFVFMHKKMSTVFTPEYRLTGLDRNDPRIEEGMRIVFRSLDELNGRLESEGISLIVLLIPTKELVFKDVVIRGSDSIPPAYSRLVENEEWLLESVKSRFDDYGIRYVDPLPDLRELIDIGINPYPRTHDSHPAAAGYQAIAEAIAAHPFLK